MGACASMRIPFSFAETAGFRIAWSETLGTVRLYCRHHHGSAVLGEHTARTVHVPNMQAPVVVPIDDLIQDYIDVGASARGSGRPVHRIMVVPVTVGTVPVSVGTVPARES